MPPHAQNEQTVRGSGGTLRTATTGVIETDNYAHGGDFDVAASAAPQAVDLADAVAAQEIVITSSDSAARLVMQTTGGDTVDLALKGGTGSFDKWEVDSFSIEGGAASGGWAGE